MPGQTDEIPEEDVFKSITSVEVGKMEPGRVASMIENYFYTPRSVTRAVRDFIPRPDDVILASNPRTGDRALLRILRLINARDEEEFQHVIATPTSEGVPWIESRFVDGNPDVLNAEQPGSRRLFKSHMAHQGLEVRKRNAPRFISLARHPVDFRMSWFRYLSDCYNLTAEREVPFEDMFSPNDFVDVSATNAQILPQAKILTYEHTMIDWYLESKRNKRVFVVFYEEMVLHTKKVIKDVAEFLEAGMTDERVNRIAEVVVEEGLIPKLDRDGKSHDRFGDGFAIHENHRDRRAQTMAEENALEFSWESCEKMKEKWRRSLESTQAGKNEIGSTYEEFFEKSTGNVFPFTKVYPPRPLKNGPLDQLGRKCVVM